MDAYIIRNEDDSFSPDKLKLKPPRKVRLLNNTFYFQTLTYEDRPLYIQTPFFISNGMSYSSFTNMRQMRVTFPTSAKNYFEYSCSICCGKCGMSLWRTKSLVEGVWRRKSIQTSRGLWEYLHEIIWTLSIVRFISKCCGIYHFWSCDVIRFVNPRPEELQISASRVPS